MAKIKASGAPIFVILATPKFTIQSYAFGKAFGYTPTQIYVNSVGATSAYLKIAVGAAGAAYVNGSLSDAYLKDPSSPAQASDPAVKEYKQLMAKFDPSGDPTDQLNMYGFAKAWTTVQVLKAAGKDLTRAGLMKAARSMAYTQKLKNANPRRTAG